MTNNVFIISGDGDTPQTAILFSKCYVDARVQAEYSYICERFGKEGTDWERGPHFTSFDFFGEAGNDLLSEWSISFSGGIYRSVYFDTRNTLYKDE